ncbi:MAG: class I SAM-dependent methyltransferase [Sarcina sp.]
MTVELEKHYNKFCEDKRLTRGYAKVEYYTSLRYIHKYLEGMEEAKILDVGAGTGRYSIPLSEEGYNVTAVELVKHNLGVLKSKGSNVKAYQGTALDLKRFKDDTFDMTLVFGPMYHLYTTEDRVKALEEAKRVTKKGGYILVAYLMNEYSILTHGFIKGNIKEAISQGKVDENFHVVNKKEDLYDYVRIEDIDKINEIAKVERVQIIAADGHANFMRQTLNNMDEETFNLFLEYHYKTCERMDLIGASAHTVDILQK